MQFWSVFDIVRRQLQDISTQIANQDLWQEQDKAIALTQTQAELQHFVDICTQIQQLQADVTFMQSYDDFSDNDVQIAQEKLTQLINNTYLTLAFSHETDKLNCFVEIRAGSGGTESQNWAYMLFQMYTRFAEQNGFTVELQDIDYVDAQLIQSANLRIEGTYAYGWLKFEHGVHRLVRISPYDRAKRRHTSFASVWIIPKLDTAIQMDIKPADLEIRECRASGAGGQHVNKTNSAIEIVHKPTGIRASSQQQRCQHQNRKIAMQMLEARLYLYKQQQLEQDNQKHIQEKTDISWGQQIRSYTLTPYLLAKDNRTGHQTSDVLGLLNGALQPFLEQSLNQCMHSSHTRERTA